MSQISFDEAKLRACFKEVLETTSIGPSGGDIDLIIPVLEKHGLPRTLAPMVSFACYWSNDLLGWVEGDLDKDILKASASQSWSEPSPKPMKGKK